MTRVLRSCGAAVVGTAADVTNTFFPSDCLVCGLPMTSLGSVRVCDTCRERVKPQDAGTLCSLCGDALGMESARFAAALGATECTLCRLAPPEFERAVAFATYDAETREMLHLLKFNGMRQIAESVLAQGMASAVATLRGQAAGELVVVPVPLFGARERSRGFNQAALLAEAAVKKLKKIHPGWKLQIDRSALKRVRDTRALFALDPSQRRKSLRGAFRVEQPAAVRGREVLLIDDIMTTGATARECARVLLRAGAAKVWVATFAKAQPETLQMSGDTRGDVAMWTAPPKVIEPNSEQRVTF